MAMQPPSATERKKLIEMGYKPEDLDQEFGSSPEVAIASPRPATQKTETPRRTGTTAREDVVGMTRQAMNAITFGQYPKMVGALSSLSGGDGKADAEKLAKYMSEYRQAAPRKSAVAEFAGEIAPYFAAAPAAALSSIPGMAGAAARTGKAYQFARAAVPLASKVLPKAGKTVAQIAAIEGTRGASQAEEGESPLAEALKSATISLPFGRLGEVAGTYAAGRFGKSIDKMAAEATAKAQEAGQIINQWREIGQLEVTPALSKLYERSQPLRQAVTEAAESLGLPATDPNVLTEAYSKLAATGSPVFKKTILSPFLSAIDEAAQPLIGNSNISPLSKGIRGYAEAMDVGKAITRGRQTGEYLRTGTGAPEQVGGEVLVERMSRPYVSQAEREAAAQALIASIREANTAMPSTLRGAVAQGARTLLTGGPRGVGDIADIAARLGGGSFGQRMAQRAGTSIGASR